MTETKTAATPFRTVNRFRQRRGQLLRGKIETLASAKGGPVSILDIGGVREYWDNVGLDSVARIVLLNNDAAALGATREAGAADIFETAVGDARDLSGYSDGAFDLAHSNSVIEHVGPWQDMTAMAREVMRVGRSGWIQTPAWEFPIEPHFRAPFLHWFGQPLRRRMLFFSRFYRHKSVAERRWQIDRINLLSRVEMTELFPGCEIYTERFLLPKSYVAQW